MHTTSLVSRARTVLATLGLGLIASTSSADPVVLPKPVMVDANAKLINVSGPTQAIHKGEALRINVLRAAPGVCAEVRLTIDGKSRTLKNVSFPWTVDIIPADPIYPTKSGKYELAIDGAANCTGHLQYVFAYDASDMGIITDFQMVGWPSPSTAAVRIEGHGLCMLRVATYRAPYVGGNQTPYDLIFNDWKPVRLPLTVPLKSSAQVNVESPGPQVVEIIMLASKDGGAAEDQYKKQFPGFEGCAVRAPGAIWNGLGVRRTWTPPKATGGSGSGGGGSGSSGSGGAVAGGGGTGGSSSPKPATGNIASMIVPGGSFAEDEAQKIQVNGTGGCGFDLTISNKTYGGSTENTYPVLPKKLDGGATLYNGTDFGTLAEGSWKATTTGKNGCTGTGTIDFKVTPKTSTKKVLGKPTISFDQQPKSGGVFMASKDSNIWFKVVVPQSVKDEPYASCCDVEYDYLNEYGGWQPLDGTPFSDASFGLAVSQQAGVVNKSVSYFSQSATWRMKVRAYKFKTEFEWSDWVQFKVDQH